LSDERTILYLIRHGQTDWNVSMRFQGQADIPLNEVGHSQGAKLARYFARQPIERVYTSDLQRARETAAYIGSSRQLEPEVLFDLREIAFGDWEGLSMTEIQAKFPVEMDLWRNDPSKLHIPGGEAYAEAQQRVCSAVRHIVAECLGRQVAVVSHGGAIRLVLASFLGLELSGIWRLGQDSAAINRLDFMAGGRVVLRQMNITLGE